MIFYGKLDSSFGAVVSFISWVVADDVSMIDINQNSIVDGVGLLRFFQELSPPSRPGGDAVQGLLDSGILSS